MRLRLSELALEDFSAIDDYKWGAEQAEKYINALWDALEEIQREPARWRLRPDIYPESRACVCGQHLIICRVNNGVVEIARILHGAMNLGDHIPANFMGIE